MSEGTCDNNNFPHTKRESCDNFIDGTPVSREVAGIAQGLQDVAEGRTKPFEQIKEELREKVAVPTRLTAEQFWPEYWNKIPGNFNGTERSAQRFAEAFRDKSEADKADDAVQQLAHVAGRKIVELREEIERLKREGKRVDADADKWMGRAAIAETKLEAAEAELAARRERERWIPVEEKLPEENVKVRIWYLSEHRGEKKIYCERFGEISCGHWRPEGGNGNFDDHVTHWKALSAAPEVKS